MNVWVPSRFALVTLNFGNEIVYVRNVNYAEEVSSFSSIILIGWCEVCTPHRAVRVKIRAPGHWSVTEALSYGAVNWPNDRRILHKLTMLTVGPAGSSWRVPHQVAGLLGSYVPCPPSRQAWLHMSQGSDGCSLICLLILNGIFSKWKRHYRHQTGGLKILRKVRLVNT